MKIFIDTGDIAEIKEAHAMGAIDGVTTNPSLLAKAKVSMDRALASICEVVDPEGRHFAWIGVWTGEGTRQRTRVVPLAADAGGGRREPRSRRRRRRSRR